MFYFTLMFHCKPDCVSLVHSSCNEAFLHSKNNLKKKMFTFYRRCQYIVQPHSRSTSKGIWKICGQPSSTVVNPVGSASDISTATRRLASDGTKQCWWCSSWKYAVSSASGVRSQPGHHNCWRCTWTPEVSQTHFGLCFWDSVLRWRSKYVVRRYILHHDSVRRLRTIHPSSKWMSRMETAAVDEVNSFSLPHATYP